MSEFQMTMVVAEVSNPGPSARMVKGVANADGVQPQFWLSNTDYEALARAGKSVMRGSVIGFPKAKPAGKLETEYFNSNLNEMVPLLTPRQRYTVTISKAGVLNPTPQSLALVDAFEAEREERRQESSVLVD